MGDHLPAKQANVHSTAAIMSWDSYIKQMEDSPDVDAAMIAGFNGGLWAKGAKFQHNAQEITTIYNGFANQSQFSASGLVLEGVKYMFLRGDTDTLYVRKGAVGACICKTKQAIVICKYNEEMTAGQCNTVCERIKDYLVGNDY